MCGIAGLIRRGGPVARRTLESMARQLAHRGPDATGIYRCPELGLVHTRLAIIDPQGGAQPLHSADGNLILVANGEIYNFVELRRELTARGHRFHTASDCEAILHAYAEHGLAALDQLHGMFAFALYDRRARRLILARDRLGIKPLYFARSARGWAFASEVKALLPTLERSPQVNPRALAQLFHAGAVGGEEALLAGVQQVRPGCAIIVDANMGTTEHRYWRLTPGPLITGGEHEALERFEALFEQVMVEHTRSDVPYGLLLSGGVDSGALAAVLAGRQPGALNTYSVGFGGAAAHRSELQAAQQVSRLYGTRHHAIEIDPTELQARVVEAVWSTDAMIRDPAILPTLLLAREAARHVKVVFTGEGGDEVFAGYGRYCLRSPGRWLHALFDQRGGGLARRSPWTRECRQLCFGQALHRAWQERRTATCEAWSETAPAWGHLRRRQYVDMRTALPDGLLVKVDRALMAHGVEGRVPFLDHRVVQFGLSLPAELKIRGRLRKYLLKRWAERHLPHAHLYAKKRGFHTPLDTLLSGWLVDELRQTLPHSPGIRAWFRPEGVRRLLTRQAEHGDVTGQVWSLLLFSLWHCLFVDAGVAESPAAAGIAEVLGAATSAPAVASAKSA